MEMNNLQYCSDFMPPFVILFLWKKPLSRKLCCSAIEDICVVASLPSDTKCKKSYKV